MKWGEYSSDVQFMLQRSDPLQSASQKSPVSDLKAALATRQSAIRGAAGSAQHQQQTQLQNDKKIPNNTDEQSSALLASPTHRRTDNVGIVRGIPQALSHLDETPSPQPNININNNTNPASHHQQPQLHHHQTNPSISSTASSAATTLSLGGSSSSTTSSSNRCTPAAEFNTADVRNSLDRKTTTTPTSAIPIDSTTHIARNTSPAGISSSALSHDETTASSSTASLLSLLQSSGSNAVASAATLQYAQGPPISSNGALVPPPYRDPPPPRASPSGGGPLISATAAAAAAITSVPASASNAIIAGTSFADALLHHRFDAASLSTTFVQVKDMAASQTANDASSAVATNNIQTTDAAGVIFHNAHYRELVQLIKYQRDQLTVQQTDLGKFDAEIGYLEQREREQLQQLDAIAREIGKADRQFRQGQEQLQQLQYVEEENELVHQQEKTLKSEITLLRSKLANCETELLQYKNKVRLLLDDIQLEQRHASAAAAASVVTAPQLQLERHFMSEVERIQGEIDQAIRMAESAHQTADHLKQEVAGIESTIAEKKKQVEQLVNEMKEVNLQSLTAVAPSDEIRHLLEGKCFDGVQCCSFTRCFLFFLFAAGSSRPGSTRRIIGSPRQLENAVPTSKNPHGVWV